MNEMNDSRLRREQDILERLENVKRLIQTANMSPGFCQESIMERDLGE